MYDNFRYRYLNDTSPLHAFVNIKHVPGLLESLKGALHYLAADAENALAYYQRSLKQIPYHHKRGQLFAHTGQILAYQMLGNLETGLLDYHKTMERYINRDSNYHAMYLAKLGLMYWVDADLTALSQIAESITSLAKESPQYAISPYYSLYYFGIIHYHRNELKFAEEKLVEIVKAHYAASPINFAHSTFALALTYQAQGRPDQAREISESVVIDSIESNNADMLQVSRAFEAELAFRQGRLTEAFRWLEKYHVKPFLPTFRFYMPQFTAVKILLAQETTESRRRVADLLGQLHDFLSSIRNNRFRIDALALLALLHDVRDEDSAALKKLSEALELAEPAGFIRLFVDLGPQLADLLKQLIEQKIAVGYIKRVVDAFSEDDHRLSWSPSLSASRSPRLRLTPSPSHLVSQPLDKLITNRELEILTLLEQRLHTKEIAEKLSI